MNDASQVESLFFAALERGTPAEQAAFLDSACSGNLELRRQVERLLNAHPKVGKFLQNPAVAAPAPMDRCDATQEFGDSTDGESKNGNERDDDENAYRQYLHPSTRPDSLGKLDHYDVLAVLGRGGFGIVFRSFDEVLQRVVAIKMLSPQMAATSPARKRFLREARSSAQVRHENVVQVYGVEEKPLPYLVMEFIPGETLQQRLDRTGPLDVPEVLRIGRQIAEGLAAAHATDLIHRDIKPGNVLIEGAQQKAKITDFGLARAADDASISQSGLIVGTPLYMAPEQARGEHLDHRADLFSLGSVLYQMVAGRPPFRANSTMGVLKRVAEDAPRPIREIIPETPQWLCDIITKLHAKNPQDRFQSAREVADVLTECEARLKAQRKDFPSISQKRPVRSTGKWKWAAAAAILLPLIGYGLYAMLRNTSDHEETGGKQPAELSGRFALKFDGTNNYVDVPTLRLDGLNEFTVEARVRWAGRKDKGTIVVSMGDPLFALDMDNAGSVVPYLMRDRKASHCVGASVPDTAWHDIAATVSGWQVEVFIDGKKQTTQTPAPAGLGSLTPPRNRFMIGAGLAWDVPAPIYHFQGEISGLRVSRGVRYRDAYTPLSQLTTDSDTLALYHFGAGKGIVLKDASGNGHDGNIVGATWVALPPSGTAGVSSERAGVPPKSISVAGACIPRTYSSDGKWLVTQTFRSNAMAEICVWEVATGELKATFNRVPPGIQHPVFSPDGTLLAIQEVEQDQFLVFVEVGSFKARKRWKIPPIGEIYMAFNRTGKIVATQGAGTIVFWNVETGEEIDRLTDAGSPFALAFSPTADVLAFEDSYRSSQRDGRWGLDSRIVLVDVDPKSPNYKKRLQSWEAPDNGYAHRIEFTPDGSRVIFARNNGKQICAVVADSSSGKVLHELGPDSGFHHVLISRILRDGKTLLTVQGNRFRETFVWNIEEGKSLGSFPIPPLGGHAVIATDPSGQTLCGGGTDTPALSFHAISPVQPPIPAIQPFSDADAQRIAALPVNEQVAEVRKELKLRNPDFDGTVTPTLDGDTVVGLKFSAMAVRDISPVRALTGLRSLDCRGNGPTKGMLADLTPLKDLKLTTLVCEWTHVSDLKPLEQMPLTSLRCSATDISDLTPLKGKPLKELHVDNTTVSDVTVLADMPLTVLNCSYTQVASVKPLKGMPLIILWANNSEISDLSPLKDMRLEWITIQSTKVSDLSPLKGMPLTQIGYDFDRKRDLEFLRSFANLKTINDKPADEFLK